MGELFTAKIQQMSLPVSLRKIMPGMVEQYMARFIGLMNWMV